MSSVVERYCFMIVPGHGQVSLQATALTFGISIISNESETRDDKAMYVLAKTSGSFTLDLSFSTYDEYTAFGNIIRDYGLALSRGSVSTVIRVLIPSVIDAKTGKGFDRVGIPKSTIPFGDEVGALARKMSLSFMGTTDPYNPIGSVSKSESGLNTTEYQAVVSKEAQAAYFYPSGSQLKGLEYGTDTLYDSKPLEFSPPKHRAEKWVTD